MKYISKILIEVCVIATATLVSISLVVVALDKETHKPDRFQCPHCGTTLQWSDDELWRGYIECRSGWTAATPTPKTPNDVWVYTVPTNAGWKMNITTNRVWITRDPIDDMPMYSVDNNGGLAL